MDASQEYDSLRKDCPFIPDLGLIYKSTDLSITWLNFRSLRKHAIHISGDVHFHTDILSFEYRNILPRENILDILLIKLTIPLISTKVFYFVLLY